MFYVEFMLNMCCKDRVDLMTTEKVSLSSIGGKMNILLSVLQITLGWDVLARVSFSLHLLDFEFLSLTWSEGMLYVRQGLTFK